MFSRSPFNKLRHELIFIGLSVLLLVGIGLLPEITSNRSSYGNTTPTSVIGTITTQKQ